MVLVVPAVGRGALAVDSSTSHSSSWRTPAQQSQQPQQDPQNVDEGREDPELNWSPRISDMPMTDLTGEWVFDSAGSDPMVEVWRDRRILYSIEQQPGYIRLEFRPENGRPNIRTYRWDGGVAKFERGEAEVRERGLWTDGGDAFEIEGRWWNFDDTATIHSYRFSYRVERALLEFSQSDEHGETVWRFRREQS